jgi:NNP family nitrate/nitrite transporter-like MFS transporter
MSDDKIKALEKRMDVVSHEVDRLHSTLEARGVNSRGTTDIFGRKFMVPVDAEHKATYLKILSTANPHMHAFHAAWFGFFSTFFSTFGAAPLAPVLKKATTLGMTRSEIQLGNIASVTSNIICRFIMGVVCDKMGPRRGMAFVLVITMPGIIGIAFANSAAVFITCRAVIGMSLASFVACQVWCTQMFSKSIVGVANATAGGWGNLGGGLTTLLMPIFYRAILSFVDNENIAWRLCFIVPLLLHIFGAIFAMTGRDLPDGNYKELETSGAKQKSSTSVVTKVGLSNVNAWILTVTYGLCFGVELTMVNIATLYFYEYHAMSQTLAGLFGSIFGMVNIFARSLGGITSDYMNARYGMRGRLWGLWFFQTLEGVLCLLMGVVTINMTAPDFSGVKDTIGYHQIGEDWVPFGGIGTSITERIHACGSLQVEITAAHRAANLSSLYDGLSTVVISDPPSPWGTGDECVSNQNMLGLVVFIMFLFSIAVQMAEGLTFGIVPSVSRPALGVVSGMVGAGGNAGALVTNAAFFLSDSVRTDTGFINMGILIIVGTLSLFFCYFPDMGGMLFAAGAIKYDPQRIKPPDGYKGSDDIKVDTQAMPEVKYNAGTTLADGPAESTTVATPATA